MKSKKHIVFDEAIKNKHFEITLWSYAEDIKEPEIIELSLQDIATKLNIPVEQIRIKD